MNARVVAHGLCLRYGGLAALTDVSFVVEPGQRCAFIGPNGAGKSSLFNVVSGLSRATAGSVTVDGEETVGRSPATLAAAGVARTFQEGGLFPGLNVLNNVMTGGHLAMRGVPWWRRSRQEEARLRERAMATLDRFGLARHADRPVGLLPYGTQKLVEFARALLRRPRLLLLDEPVAGLTADERELFRAQIERAHRAEGCTLILVEHDLQLVASLVEQVHVLDFGRLIASGTMAQVRDDPAVRAAYLGRS